MQRQYWRVAHGRAIRDARNTLWIESRERFMIALILAVIALAIIWLLGGREIAGHELIVQIALTAAVIVAFPFVYFWKLMTMPAKMQEEANARIDFLKHELEDATGFSDEMRSNIYSKIEKLSPESNHALHRVVTAEIEADQLNVDMRGELERAGFLKPAFAYTPAEFIERYRSLIQQWFREHT